ncbi:myeloid cell surface antigen CD33 [Betta splendens]|uniref:Myeloid cell surface antigen CD33 n=1 Tax=Betta splendens TaxID=158456 RepID=A0A6P7KRH3_BETSP|nr:myeloid cell surface antigen CD33 [Betta splendens]
MVPTKQPHTNMDKTGKMMILSLLLAGVFSPAFAEVWKATVVEKLDALVSSCVVFPCTFTTPKDLPSSKLRGIWHFGKNKEDRIYHEDRTRIMENYRGRTQLLGRLGEKNCTLEMTEVKDHDNGPFCFRIELAEKDQPTKEMFSFVEDCVTLNMLHDAPKPELRYRTPAVMGHPYTATCKVRHTCSSHRPKLEWSRGTAADIMVSHTDTSSGYSEVESILTITPEEKDDHQEVTCTATFHERKTSSATFTLYVKRVENYNHIILPIAGCIGSAVIFGIICIFMVKKYKRRIAELQNQDGSMFNRLSRLSRRFRSDGPGPFNSDQRRSIWSRFSRRPRRDMGDMGQIPNNSKPCDNQKVSKARFPSPKSQKKSCNYNEDLDNGDDYMNTADLNVYGNI